MGRLLPLGRAVGVRADWREHPPGARGLRRTAGRGGDTGSRFSAAPAPYATRRRVWRAPDRSGVQREEAKPAATAQHYLFEATGVTRLLAVTLPARRQEAIAAHRAQGSDTSLFIGTLWSFT